ncbi:MAG: major capsid protein [Rhodobacteraceae bacterium]|nr:major capsid protein [Paracoccaceae bacterium]
MSKVLEEIRTPWAFVTDLLFGETNTNPTETIAIDSIIGGRKMAPFVTPGAGAALLQGMKAQRSLVTAPNIRAKRPFSSRQLLFNRSPGSPIFVDGGHILSEVQRKIARDLKYGKEQIDQTLEWMCCQALTGVLTYNIATANGQPGDAFTIDYGRPPENTIVLTSTDTWDTPKATATKSIDDLVVQVKEMVSDKVGVPITDCILGKDASDAFRRNEQMREDQDNRRIVSGELNLVKQFEASGALFLGELYGVRWWRYSRDVEDPFGTTINLIEADKAHFVSRSPGADNIIEYGAIDDLDAALDGPISTKFFSKSWREKDPSTLMYLWQSRPLPVPRRPESMVTVTVV